MENSDHMVPIVDDRNNQSVDISELYDVENELPEDDDLDGTQHMMSQSHAVVSATKELSKTSYRGPSRGYASGSRKSANSTSLGHASTPVLTLNDLESVVGPSKLSTMSKASYQRAKAHQHNMSLKKAAKNHPPRFLCCILVNRRTKPFRTPFLWFQPVETERNLSFFTIFWTFLQSVR